MLNPTKHVSPALLTTAGFELARGVAHRPLLHAGSYAAQVRNAATISASHKRSAIDAPRGPSAAREIRASSVKRKVSGEQPTTHKTSVSCASRASSRGQITPPASLAANTTSPLTYRTAGFVITLG